MVGSERLGDSTIVLELLVKRQLVTPIGEYRRRKAAPDLGEIRRVQVYCLTAEGLDLARLAAATSGAGPVGQNEAQNGSPESDPGSTPQGKH